MGGSNEWALKAKFIVWDHIEETSCRRLEEGEVGLLWFTYIHGGWKALVVVYGEEEIHYEVVHDGRDDKTHLSVYERTMKVDIPHTHKPVVEEKVTPKAGEVWPDISNSCADHKPVQHRDGYEPWCGLCGHNLRGRDPIPLNGMRAGSHDAMEANKRFLDNYKQMDI